jgi:hypothetical protein
MSLYGLDTKEVVAFVLNVAPSTSGSITERIKADCTIEDIVVRFYAGQQRDLRIRPKLRRTGRREENLITFPAGAETWLAGEDDRESLDVSVPGQLDDEIVMYYENIDPVNTYTMVVYVTIDYQSGVNRSR